MGYEAVIGLEVHAHLKTASKIFGGCFNRCGVPLIEDVSEPEISSPEEAVSYLRKLRSSEPICSG
jgi:aspartyl-tRNA(Asn)/glutamyl-tRNA(Gln) amidotransferase subunit B